MMFTKRRILLARSSARFPKVHTRKVLGSVLPKKHMKTGHDQKVLFAQRSPKAAFSLSSTAFLVDANTVMFGFPNTSINSTSYSNTGNTAF